MRLIKYSSAGVAAAMLFFAGTGGTMAAWADSASLATSGSVSSGFLQLKVVPEGTSGWVDLTADTADGPVKKVSEGKPIADINTYRIVPGSTIAFVGKVKVGLEGDNLKAKLKATLPSQGATGNLVEGTTADNSGPNSSVVDNTKGVTVDTKIYKWNTDVDTSITTAEDKGSALEAGEDLTPATAGVLNHDNFEGSGDPSHLAVVKLTFNKDANAKMNQSLTLAGMTLKLTQEMPTVANI